MVRHMPIGLAPSLSHAANSVWSVRRTLALTRGRRGDRAQRADRLVQRVVLWLPQRHGLRPFRLSSIDHVMLLHRPSSDRTSRTAARASPSRTPAAVDQPRKRRHNHEGSSSQHPSEYATLPWWISGYETMTVTYVPAVVLHPMAAAQPLPGRTCCWRTPRGASRSRTRERSSRGREAPAGSSGPLKSTHVDATVSRSPL
jgi:hypothetical protein